MMQRENRPATGWIAAGSGCSRPIAQARRSPLVTVPAAIIPVEAVVSVAPSVVTIAVVAVVVTAPAPFVFVMSPPPIPAVLTKPVIKIVMSLLDEGGRCELARAGRPLCGACRHSTQGQCQ